MEQNITNKASRAANFLATYQGDMKPINIQIDTAAEAQIKKNRECVLPIVKCALFLAKLGLPFRGHRDSGPLDFYEAPKKGEGLFRSLLKFRAVWR